jgi:hypothetical protein
MIKPGVDLRGLVPQMAIAYIIACVVYNKHQCVEQCVITSGVDSVHGPNSLHPLGKALDLRTNTLSGDVALMIHHDLKQALGGQFDVVLEKDHIHVEFDPKEVTDVGATI